MKRFFILFIGLFFFLCSESYSLTLSQLRTEIRRIVKDTDSVRQRYSNTVLLDYINEAQREIVNVTWLCRNTQSYTLTNNTSYYDLPSDLIAVSKVYFKSKNNQTTELTEKNQSSLFSENPDWEKQTGNPNTYWVSHPTSTVNTSLRISYIPIPTTASTGTVTIFYYNTVNDLSSDSDVPFNGRLDFVPFHMAIVYHVSARLKLLEKKTDESTAYYTLYGNYVKEIKDKINLMPNYYPSIRTGN